jgi:ribosomal protein S18 acetylase RimI-like enzyme
LTEGITYRAMQLDDAPAVSDLVLRTFRTFIAPGYRTEGVQAFTGFAQPQTIQDRLKLGALGFVSIVDDCIVGMIEMRNLSHVTLLFVDSAWQRRGISRELLRLGIEICRQRNPELREVTVNSSPYAVEVYRRLGFVPTNAQQDTNGILYVPMKLKKVDSF